MMSRALAAEDSSYLHGQDTLWRSQEAPVQTGGHLSTFSCVAPVAPPTICPVIQNEMGCMSWEVQKS